MKCPQCKVTMTEDIVKIVQCPKCNEGQMDETTYIDPAELLRLIEAAISNPKNRSRDYSVPSWGRYKAILDAIKSYLSGDTEPLRRLAGEDE